QVVKKFSERSMKKAVEETAAAQNSRELTISGDGKDTPVEYVVTLDVADCVVDMVCNCKDAGICLC
ncbi:unnamed protein product, partial [Rotaria sp. Silwood1]